MAALGIAAHEELRAGLGDARAEVAQLTKQMLEDGSWKEARFRAFNVAAPPYIWLTIKLWELDVFRDPPTPADLARRRVIDGPLDPTREALLARWGYPHLMEGWRYHFTLSDPVPDAGEREVWEQLARTFFTPALERPWRCDALSLFVEPSAGAPMQLLRRYPLRG